MSSNSTTRSRLRQIASLILGVAIVIGLIWYTGYESFLDTLSQASLPLLGLSLSVYLVSWPVHVYRMKACLQTLNQEVGLWRLFEINVAGYGLNIVLPAKIGDIARAIYLTQEQISVGSAVATVGYVRLADLGSVSILVLLTVGLLDMTLFPTWLNRLLLAIVLFGILLVTVIITNRYAANSDRVTDLITHIGNRVESQLLHGALDAGQQASLDFNVLTFTPSTFIVTLITSILIWLLEALTAYVVAIALGVQISLLLTVFVVSIANLAKILPLTPGGLGVYEAAFTSILGLFGIPVAASLAVAIVEHNLKNLFLVVVGTPIATKLGTKTVLERQAKE